MLKESLLGYETYGLESYSFMGFEKGNMRHDWDWDVEVVVVYYFLSYLDAYNLQKDQFWFFL
jgi:hypothetical protein